MGMIIAVLAGIFFGVIFFDHSDSLAAIWLGGLSGGLIVKVLQLSKQLRELQISVAELAKKYQKEIRPAPVVQKPISPDVPKRQEIPVAPTTRDEPVSIRPEPVPPAIETPGVASAPGLVDKLANRIRRFFTEGNPIVRVGMVVMFFGLSYLVKYASSLGLLPIEFRLSCVLAIAIAMLVLGWKNRLRAGGYGLVLQGGGIAAIYLTLFSAAKVFGLMSLGLAFGLLFVVVLLGAVLALLQNAQVLAILSTAGGFLAPILTSTGEGSHVALFSFYFLLNAGILAIAWYKAWRLLNWVGFVFTFVITTMWGVLEYKPLLYLSTQPFLAAFFLLYLAIAILFSFKQPPNLKGVVDGSLVFGLPLIAFGLQVCLLRHSEHGLPVSAVTLSALYLALAAWLARKHLVTHRVLVESFLALGVGFATLAVPLALDASWTSATWALEATGLVWIGFRQARLRPRIVGYLLHLAAAISLMVKGGPGAGDIPIVHGDFINLAVLAFTAFGIAYVLHRFTEHTGGTEKLVMSLALVAGFAWWFMAGIMDIQAHVVDTHHFASILLFVSSSAALALWLSRKTNWPGLGNCLYALLPFVIVLSVNYWWPDHHLHPVHGFGLLSIVLFFAVQYRFLFWAGLLEKASTEKRDWLNIWHVLTAWFLFSLIIWESAWQEKFHLLDGTASDLLWFATFTLPFVLLLALSKKVSWPFSRVSDYKNSVPVPLFVACLLWFLAVCDHSQQGGQYYLPLINLLDISQLAVIVLFVYVFSQDYFAINGIADKKWRLGLLGALLFIWINVALLRAMHHYLAVPYQFDSLWGSPPVQMALSILWSICALIVMNTKQRTLWMIGAVLLGAVVLKLATKDLTATGTLARIISFMGVGSLMLLIGYLSPIPAKSPVGENK